MPKRQENIVPLRFGTLEFYFSLCRQISYLLPFISYLLCLISARPAGTLAPARTLRTLPPPSRFLKGQASLRAERGREQDVSDLQEVVPISLISYLLSFISYLYSLLSARPAGTLAPARTLSPSGGLQGALFVIRHSSLSFGRACSRSG